jgi:hypothetical protein
MDDATLNRTVTLLFRELSRLHAEAGRKLAVVYLPTERDYDGGSSEGWRRALESLAQKDGFHFIDLIPELRALSPEAMANLFIPEGTMGYVNAAGHYTEAGNLWVARLLHEKLQR